jgi:hypothetical protein
MHAHGIAFLAKIQNLHSLAIFVERKIVTHDLRRDEKV